MTINTNPAGRLAEFFKTTRKDTGADILVNSGIKKIKTGSRAYPSGATTKALATSFNKGLDELADTLDSKYGKDATMRATLEILADEFLAHADNQDQPWATADAIKTLYQDLEKAKEEKERYWI